MNMLKLLSAFLISAALLLPAQSTAQPGEGKHKMWEELGLTADQAEKLKTLHQEMRTARKAHFTEIGNVRKKISEELKNATPSQNVLSGYVTDLNNIQKDMIQKKIDHLLKIKGILTAEQFQKLVDKEWNGLHDDKRSCPKMAGCKGSKQECSKKNAPACKSDEM